MAPKTKTTRTVRRSKAVTESNTLTSPRTRSSKMNAKKVRFSLTRTMKKHSLMNQIITKITTYRLMDKGKKKRRPMKASPIEVHHQQLTQ